MSTTTPFNYAPEFGIQSLPAAIVFTVLYALLLVFFSFKSFIQPAYVHFILTFFCIIRVVEFTLRTVLASSKEVAESLGLATAEQILSIVGYAGLLYSAYILVLNRTVLSDIRAADHPILKFIQNREIFRVLLEAGVVLGVVAGLYPAATQTQNLDLYITSVAIFLFLTLVQVLQTAILAHATLSAQSQYYIRGKDSAGVRYRNHILLVISILLIIREVFSVATVNEIIQVLDSDYEHSWYPLIPLPEILAVILFITPGLVPRREELQQHHEAQQHTTTE